MEDDQLRRWLEHQIGDPAKVKEMVSRKEFLDALHAAAGDSARLRLLIEHLSEELERDEFRRRFYGGIAAMGRRSKEIAVWGSAMLGAWYGMQALGKWLLAYFTGGAQ